MEWQPIETAPKDGTAILGWNEDTETQECVFFHERDYWCSSTYYEFGQQGYDRNIVCWMPLPPDAKP